MNEDKSTSCFCISHILFLLLFLLPNPGGILAAKHFGWQCGYGFGPIPASGCGSYVHAQRGRIAGGSGAFAQREGQSRHPLFSRRKRGFEAIQGRRAPGHEPGIAKQVPRNQVVCGGEPGRIQNPDTFQHFPPGIPGHDLGSVWQAHAIHRKNTRKNERVFAILPR